MQHAILSFYGIIIFILLLQQSRHPCLRTLQGSLQLDIHAVWLSDVNDLNSVYFPVFILFPAIYGAILIVKRCQTRWLFAGQAEQLFVIRRFSA